MRHRVFIVCIALCRSFSRKSLPPREKVKFLGATRGSKIKTRRRVGSLASHLQLPRASAARRTPGGNTDYDAS